MSESNGAADAAAATDTPAQQGTQGPAADAAGAETPQSWEQLGWRNPDELKRFVAQQRNEMKALKAELDGLKGTGKKSEPERPAARGEDGGGEVAKLRADVARLTFNSALAEHTHLNAAQRSALQKLAASENPEALEGWVRDRIAEFGWQKPTKPEQRPTGSTGAPAAGRAVDALSPAVITTPDYETLSESDRRKWWDDNVNKDRGPRLGGRR